MKINMEVHNRILKIFCENKKLFSVLDQQEQEGQQAA